MKTYSEEQKRVGWYGGLLAVTIVGVVAAIAYAVIMM